MIKWVYKHYMFVYSLKMLGGDHETSRCAKECEVFAAAGSRPSGDVYKRQGIIIAGLFIGSSMLSLSSMEPRLLGVPVLAFFGYLGAAVLSIWVVLDINRRRL